MLFDTHVHLSHFEPDEREKQIATAKELGTRVFVEVGSTAENSKNAIELAESRDDFYCGVACHPNAVEKYFPGDLDKLRDLVRSSKKVVCIGECGLDYSEATPERAEKQRALFRDMIRLAREFGLPLNMHSDRLSGADLLQILREEKAHEVGGMMHNFSGNVAMAQQFLDMGMYVSACVLIHHPQANRLRSVFAELPLGHLVMDSDAPGAKLIKMDDSPIPFDMDLYSEPRMLRYIADKIAEVKHIPVETVEAVTALNASQLFRVPLPAS